MTLHEALIATRTRLVATGIAPDEAAIDADLFVRTILGWDRARLLAELQRPAPAELEPRLSELVRRREQREPTPYILGTREFWGLDFFVSPAVLIPRPETELIVEEALALLPIGGPARVADVGTGSACIAVSIAVERLAISVIATDVSEDALQVARENAKRHSVADRVAFKRTSYLNDVDGAFDLIVANPPYVKQGDLPALSRQVSGYEPHVALFGGEDGLRDVAGVLEAAQAKLLPAGWLIFEFGLGEDDRISELIADYRGFRLDRFRKDLQGVPRTAVVQKAQRSS